MSWDVVGAIGQAISALALVFVFAQIRHARREFARTVSQTRTEGVVELLSFRAANDAYRRAYVKMLRPLDAPPNVFVEEAMKLTGVTAEEAYSVYWQEFANWHHRASTFRSVDLITAGERTEFEASIRSNYHSYPISRLWYESTRSHLNPDFVRYVDTLLSAIEKR